MDSSASVSGFAPQPAATNTENKTAARFAFTKLLVLNSMRLSSIVNSIDPLERRAARTFTDEARTGDDLFSVKSPAVWRCPAGREMAAVARLCTRLTAPRLAGLERTHAPLRGSHSRGCIRKRRRLGEPGHRRQRGFEQRPLVASCPGRWWRGTPPLISSTRFGLQERVRLPDRVNELDPNLWRSYRRYTMSRRVVVLP